jgi:lipopolysaccharide biosynthesis glycosyltransferase
MNRIFIGWDNGMPDAGNVLAYSLNKHAKRPIDISFLNINELKAKYDFNRKHDPLASTEFTYSRFLIPYICGYEGTAMFLDNDMLAFGDINEIFDLDMTGLALRVVKHQQEVITAIKMDGKAQSWYPRKNWSSMMLMDCSKLRCWTKEVVENQTGAFLHRFETIPDEQVGEISKTWNVLDEIKSDTKLWHFTSGGPYHKNYADMPGSGIWYKYYYDWTHGR